MGEIFTREHAARSKEWSLSPEPRAVRQPPIRVCCRCTHAYRASKSCSECYCMLPDLCTTSQEGNNANRTTHAFYTRDPNAGEVPVLSNKAFMQGNQRSPGPNALQIFEDFSRGNGMRIQNPVSPFGSESRGIRASSASGDIFVVQPPMRF
eukprot:3472579-Rhodomonas_salina.1